MFYFVIIVKNVIYLWLLSEPTTTRGKQLAADGCGHRYIIDKKSVSDRCIQIYFYLVETMIFL